MDPILALKDEHRVIERMLKILEAIAQRLEGGQEVSSQVLERCLDFIRSFADSCHHGKEEDLLFPALEAHGIPKGGGPIGVMLVEHNEGRKFVAALADALQMYESSPEQARGGLVENARGYARLLAQHIPKEDNILYPMAEQALSEAEKGRLLASFEEVERDRIGGKHHQYLELVSELEKEMKISGVP